VANPTGAQPAPIDVVLADDHAMVRAGLRLVLEESSQVRVVGEAGDVPSAFEAVRAHRPRVAILDLNMPGGSTLASIPALRDAVPEVAIVVVTADSDPMMAREALAAGARAYVLKDAADAELLEAIVAAASGRSYLTPRLGAELATLPQDGEQLPEGSMFAGHRIEGLAGRGGMAVVYRATDLALDRRVALKLIAPGLARDPVYRSRFTAECRLAAAIDHPNVVPVYHAGEDRGRLYLTMRFVDGSDLRTLLQRQGRLEPDRAIGLTEQIAAGLDAAHARGLVHRDVKPGNVLMTRHGEEEHAYLTDFGLTMDRSHAAELTATGVAIGTAAYIAPEQARGEPLDARADVYALAGVLYRCLTGSLPYECTSEIDTLAAHLHEPPPRLRELAPEFPAALEDVLLLALAKAPDDRPPSAGAFARAARTALVDG
jgi:DNA-binding NarL/FixJ family response regulator/tRNA A-37 threonylcarbamoyl transferase component Bud32